MTKEEALAAIAELLNAMETCHVCQGALSLDEGPVHCEDCSACCEDHEPPDCKPMNVFHSRAWIALRRLGYVDPT